MFSLLLGMFVVQKLKRCIGKCCKNNIKRKRQIALPAALQNAFYFQQMEIRKFLGLVVVLPLIVQDEMGANTSLNDVAEAVVFLCMFSISRKCSLK